jgi:hypothetical protein
MSMKVTTWTDGLGVWHASVPLGNGDEANIAKASILAQLAERGDAKFAAEHMHVEAERVTNHGTVLFRETWDTGELDKVIEGRLQDQEESE